MRMSEKNIQDLFDAMAGIYSRRLGIEIRATVKRKDGTEQKTNKKEMAK